MPVLRAKYAVIGVSEEFLTLGPSYVKDQRPKKRGWVQGGRGEDWRGLARREEGVSGARAEERERRVAEVFLGVSVPSGPSVCQRPGIP